jgi:hypothetical protein
VTRYFPMRQKRLRPRRGRILDAAYLGWIRRQPCSVPGCKSRYVEAAHVGDRGLGIRCDDRQAIALCSGHHRLRADAQHVLGKRFWAHHGIDRWEIIASYHARYELEAAA